jgi:DNA replication protein DnaC
MYKNSTVEKLRGMRLYEMAEAFQNPETGIEELTFNDRFSLLVEKEWYAKRNAKTKRLQAKAAFSQSACLEDIEYDKGRNISRKDITLIGSCLFIEQKFNIIISGKTGTGKSYLACAIGTAAIRQGHSCKYFRLPDIFAELALARINQNYLRFMENLRKTKLLIIDDIGLRSYDHEEARDLLEIAESRYNRTSTIFVSQVPHEKWYELIADPTIADAFMDRIAHNSHIIPLDSTVSMREIMAQKKMKMLDLLENSS